MATYDVITPADLTADTDAAVPHLAFPFHYRMSPKGTVPGVRDQDSFEEIRDCVAVIVRYGKGQRPEAPEFGITPPEFDVGVDIPLLLQEIEQSEPRVHMLIDGSPDPSDESIERVVIGIIESEPNAKTSSGGGNV